MKLFKPKFIQEWMRLIKEEGLKSFLGQKGWKVVLFIIVFYLIRDSILYILIPYLIYTNIIQ